MCTENHLKENIFDRFFSAVFLKKPAVQKSVFESGNLPAFIPDLPVFFVLPVPKTKNQPPIRAEGLRSPELNNNLFKCVDGNTP